MNCISKNFFKKRPQGKHCGGDQVSRSNHSSRRPQSVSTAGPLKPHRAVSMSPRHCASLSVTPQRTPGGICCSCDLGSRDQEQVRVAGTKSRSAWLGQTLLGSVTRSRGTDRYQCSCRGLRPLHSSRVSWVLWPEDFLGPRGTEREGMVT